MRDGIFALAQPTESLTTTYTLCYLLADTDRGVHVIDPGVASDANWARLEEALATIGGEVVSVTVTHMHHDHLGMASRVRRATGAPVALHRADQAAVSLDPDPFHADVLLEHGMVLDIPGRQVRVIHTPGHTSGSICLHHPENRVVFTGDHLLPNQFAGIGLGARSASNPIEDYLASLEKIAALGEVEALPGHEYRFTGVRERCEQTAAHHRSRTAEVAAILARHPQASVAEVAAEITWSAGWANLEGPSRASAIAQTGMHMQLVQQAR